MAPLCEDGPVLRSSRKQKQYGEAILLNLAPHRRSLESGHLCDQAAQSSDVMFSKCEDIQWKIPQTFESRWVNMGLIGVNSGTFCTLASQHRPALLQLQLPSPIPDASRVRHVPASD